MGAGGAIAHPISLEIGRILAFDTPNISRSKQIATKNKARDTLET